MLARRAAVVVAQDTHYYPSPTDPASHLTPGRLESPCRAVGGAGLACKST